MDSRVREIIDKSKKVVFFGGAGVSTESNIPDFRSESGLYQAMNDYGYPPEIMLSRPFFMKHTETFYDYYKKNQFKMFRMTIRSLFTSNSH
ncbi:MAG: Sir2 family NAD-dependent protein deacetylase, partial [Clostridia bacterium]